MNTFNITFNITLHVRLSIKSNLQLDFIIFAWACFINIYMKQQQTPDVIKKENDELITLVNN
jgi:hypothetical protein